jgi:hypothetical protein
MKSPAMHFIGAAACVISSIGAIHIGLLAMGYNLLNMQFLMGLARPIEYLFGIAGVISLVLFIMYGCCCHCEK